MNSPLFPKGGTSTEARRLQEAAQELATKVIDSGQFVQRGKVERLIRPQPTGIPSPVAFGALNRVLTTSDATVQLPRIEPKWIGVPLQVAKLTTDGLMYVQPSGRIPDKSRAPYLDGTSYRTCGPPGLYTFITDGFDWYSQGAEAYRLFDVRLFGASPAASGARNTSAFQAAFDAASAEFTRSGAVQEVYVPPGLYRFAISAASTFAMPLVGTTTEVHIAVLARSGVRVVAPGATFCAVAPSGANTAWYYAIFGTALNMTVGTIEQFSMVGANFDFTDTYWDSTMFTIYGLLLVGVSDLELDHLRCLNTGTVRLGRLARVMNSENVRVTNWVADFISQGCYFNYITGLKFSGYITRFSEGVDIDSPCYEVDGDLTAEDAAGGDKQCLDIAAVQNGYFRLRCRNVGEAALIYQKPDCYPTFALWCSDLVTDTPAAAPVFCDNVTLEVSGSGIHGADFRSIQVNLNREDPPTPNYWDGKGIIKRITVRALLSDCDPILCYECDGLDLTADLQDVTCGAVSRLNNAAVLLRQSRTDATAISESKLSGRAVARVKNSSRTGVRVIGPTDFHLEATVDGYNSALSPNTPEQTGIHVEGLGLKSGGFTFSSLRSRGGSLSVASGVDPVDMRFSWDGSGSGIWARDLGGHSFGSSGTQVCRLDTAALIQGQVSFPVQSYDSRSGDYDIPLGIITAPMARLASADIVNISTVSLVPSGFTVMSMRRIRGGATSSAIGTAINYDDATVPAGTVKNLGVLGNDSDGQLVSGDILALRLTRSGLGSVASGLFVRYALVEHSY